MKIKKILLVFTASATLIFSACTTSTPNNSNPTKPGNSSNTTSSPAKTSGTNVNTSGTSNTNASNTSTKVEKSGDSHEHKAPHGGTLVSFGEEFAHIELVLEKDLGKLTVYALDGEAEKPVRLKQNGLEFEIKTSKDAKPVIVKLDATENGLTGEKIGDTSEFATQSEALKGLANFEGTLKAINIRGKDFKDTKFKFPEGNEGEHEHKDEHKGEHKDDHKDEKGKDQKK